jgi:hypothetical protein
MTEFGAFLLPLVPLLALLAFLLLGRYPGCEAIVRLSERLAGRPAAGRPSTASALPKPPRSHAPAGGLLLALGLAQRPPPLPARSR